MDFNLNDSFIANYAFEQIPASMEGAAIIVDNIIPTVKPQITPTLTATPMVTPTATPTASVPELKPKAESGYVIENGILSGVEAQTSLETLIANLKNGESIVVTNEDGEIATGESALIGTGCIVKLLDTDGNTVDSAVVVISGDITGDAVVNSRDIAALQKHLLGKNELNGVCLTAGDMNNDSKSNSRDIATLQKILIDQ